MENRCVVCGDIIPEERQVCPICEGNVLPKRCVQPIGKVHVYARNYEKPKEGVKNAVRT